jgi:hypothetical protein
LVPIISAKAMNSWVPNSLVSGTPPQWVLTFTGRFHGADAVAPVVFVAKHPPGQRTTGTLSAFQCGE